MKKIKITGSGDYYTNIVTNILRERYSILEKNRVYIPITKEVVKLCNVLVKEQNDDDGIFPSSDKIDFIINKICKLYEPVIKRLQKSLEYQKEKQLEKERFYHLETEKRLIKCSKDCKNLISSATELFEFMDANLAMLNNNTYLIFNSKINLHRLGVFVSLLDGIVNGNKNSMLKQPKDDKS